MRTHNRTHNGVVFGVICWDVYVVFGYYMLPDDADSDTLGDPSSASNPLCSTEARKHDESMLPGFFVAILLIRSGSEIGLYSPHCTALSKTLEFIASTARP